MRRVRRNVWRAGAKRGGRTKWSEARKVLRKDERTVELPLRGCLRQPESGKRREGEGTHGHMTATGSCNLVIQQPNRCSSDSMISKRPSAGDACDVKKPESAIAVQVGEKASEEEDAPRSGRGGRRPRPGRARTSRVCRLWRGRESARSCWQTRRRGTHRDSGPGGRRSTSWPRGGERRPARQGAGRRVRLGAAASLAKG